MQIQIQRKKYKIQLLDPPLSMRNKGVAFCMTRIAKPKLDISYVETPARLVIYVSERPKYVKIPEMIEFDDDNDSLVEDRQELSPKGIGLRCQICSTKVNHIFL